ncbi:uncharacterized protein LOC113227860 isoform X2 [Hyposmocoma kahamanoa]|uniref:uncharacterized protein LOC113227860 isoform X2 n=1 Tax=Hyposmocoma kahamanoa TaxID=1477025 RepID=UPI000E6D6949|nr:uncharacterized protein LOC113227860 isoform X2 [Hyposmocoma kahamanoa]
MVNTTDILKELYYGEKYDSLSSLLDGINSLIKVNIQPTDKITSDLADSEFLNEVKTLTDEGIPIFFGKTLRDLKCIIADDASRDHVIYLQYNASRKLVITSTQLPHSSLQDQEFSSLIEVEDYRRILLDDRTWLHIEVTPEGLATNVHLVGQTEKWHEKLQAGLLQWDHDVDVVENITAIFDMVHFPCQDNRFQPSIAGSVKPQEQMRCCICLCQEVPDIPGLPQPLCQNPLCGMYFHRDCLFQWLLACAGGRPPAFGVATGNCPSCLQPVTCSNKDG